MIACYPSGGKVDKWNRTLQGRETLGFHEGLCCCVLGHLNDLEYSHRNHECADLLKEIRVRIHLSARLLPGCLCAGSR